MAEAVRLLAADRGIPVDTLLQVLADALSRDIAVAPRFEASLHGAALLALQASGHLDHPGSVAGPRTRIVRSDHHRAARYRAARARQQALYQTVLG